MRAGRKLRKSLRMSHHAPTPVPTVIYIHGGGSVQGTKESYQLRLLP